MSNNYKKYCPNVFVACCDEEYERGEIITITTKRGKENEHVVHNFVGYSGTKESPLYCYSITRADGQDSQDYAKSRAEKLSGYAGNAARRSNEWAEKANEGSDFLALAEPIKLGHHSEKRHRALLERNDNRMRNAIDEQDKAAGYEDRIAYWENMAGKIDLSMPESLEFFAVQLEEAKEYHKGLKDGSIPRQHSYSLTYAKKRVNDLTKKHKTAVKLWKVTS